jgi:hypothetical protein
LASFPSWATDARTVLALLGFVLYAVLRIAYSLFYNNFGLTPDDLGLGYIDLLIQSAVGTVILLVVVFVVATVVALIYVGLIGSYPELWRYFRRGFRPAGSSGPESPPPVKPGSESVTPTPQDHRHRLRAALATGIIIAFVGLVLVAGYFTPAPPGWFTLLVVWVMFGYGLIAGIKRTKRGLTGKDRTRWRRGSAAAALATLGLAILFLLTRAESDAARVQLGHPSSFTVLGFRITTWGAEDATVSWTSNQIAADLRPLAGRCLMYLGQSNGTAFLYLVSTHEVFRVPTAVAVVRTRPAVCSRK